MENNGKWKNGLDSQPSQRPTINSVGPRSKESTCFASTRPQSNDSFLHSRFLMIAIISGNLLLARSNPRSRNWIGFWYSFGQRRFVRAPLLLQGRRRSSFLSKVLGKGRQTNTPTGAGQLRDWSSKNLQSLQRRVQRRPTKTVETTIAWRAPSEVMVISQP